jgi:hypothetical protein
VRDGNCSFECATSFSSSSASSTVIVSGLSQMTWKPRSSASFAGAKWSALGVTIETAWMRCSAGSFASASTIPFQSP